MNARDWLHLMGIHHWDKWSEPVVGKAVHIVIGSEKVVMIQVARCLICNRIRIREA